VHEIKTISAGTRKLPLSIRAATNSAENEVNGTGQEHDTVKGCSEHVFLKSTTFVE
jgi:hypothetical protein